MRKIHLIYKNDSPEAITQILVTACFPSCADIHSQDSTASDRRIVLQHDLAAHQQHMMSHGWCFLLLLSLTSFIFIFRHF